MNTAHLQHRDCQLQPKKRRCRKILFFGDQTCVDFLRGVDTAASRCHHTSHVESYRDLAGCDFIFDFLLDLALQEQQFDILIVAIGSNDLLTAERDAADLIDKHAAIRRSYGRQIASIVIVGPHSSDIRTQVMSDRGPTDAERRRIGTKLAALLAQHQ